MGLWVKASDLSEHLPKRSIENIAEETLVDKKLILKIRQGDGFVREEKADKLLTSLGKPHVYSQLEFIERNPNDKRSSHISIL